MGSFSKKTFLNQWRLRLDDLVEYKKNLRKYEFETGVPLKHIHIRNFLHPILVKAIKIDRLLNKFTLTIIQDDRIKTNAPKIYACTHIGGSDIERIYEALKDPSYLLLGDPGVIYRNATGFILFFNGVICVETRDKTDRRIAKLRCIELLKNGGHLMIYPEGAWNISPNQPVMKLFPGAVDIAIETNAEIIPVAVEQYDNDFYIAIGKNISYQGFDKSQSRQLTNELRDVLCTLKWNIFETSGKGNRNDYSDDFRENYGENIVKKYSGGDLTLQDVYDGMFKSKNITDPSEAFAHLNDITPNTNNAFLFNKRLL